LATHRSSLLILAIVLVATLLVAFVARLVIIWRDKRKTATLIEE
jgi:hypothetical protein